jgi:hypothetical protein
MSEQHAERSVPEPSVTDDAVNGARGGKDTAQIGVVSRALLKTRLVYSRNFYNIQCPTCC